MNLPSSPSTAAPAPAPCSDGSDEQRPLLLDLFCGAGGAAMGYYRAGFDILGVDINPQPRYPYPFAFIKADALKYLRFVRDEVDAIHASPPCQRHARTRNMRPLEHTHERHPDLIQEVREALIRFDRPYVIENVEHAPLIAPVILCGGMFPSLRTYRHRAFESNMHIEPLEHHPHTHPIAKMGRRPQWFEYMHIAGNYTGADEARKAMGIDWMMHRELAQAIPPAYTEYIGKQILQNLQSL